MTILNDESLNTQTALFTIDEYHIETPVTKAETIQNCSPDSLHNEKTMNIPKSYDEFDVWVNKMKSEINTRNWSNPLRSQWSVERGLLFHYQNEEEFFAGECEGYCSQEDGSVLVDIYDLGESLTIKRAIRLVEARYAERTKRLSDIVAKQEALAK